MQSGLMNEPGAVQLADVLGQSACCSFEFGSNYHLIIYLFKRLENCCVLSLDLLPLKN